VPRSAVSGADLLAPKIKEGGSQALPQLGERCSPRREHPGLSSVQVDGVGPLPIHPDHLDQFRMVQGPGRRNRTSHGPPYQIQEVHAFVHGVCPGCPLELPPLPMGEGTNDPAMSREAMGEQKGQGFRLRHRVDLGFEIAWRPNPTLVSKVDEPVGADPHGGLRRPGLKGAPGHPSPLWRDALTADVPVAQSSAAARAERENHKRHARGPRMIFRGHGVA
jgi:hypothetical protein